MSTVASSGHSVAGTVAVFNRKLSLPFQKPMRIHIDNHFHSKVYTTASAISGHVSINATRDTRFDSLHIVLLGTSKTRIDGLRAPTATSHTFLKLQMPIPESNYPVPRVYEAGRTYNIPFNFVIPTYLTMSACNHRADTGGVQDHHLCLPPSVGTWEKGDFSPEMAKVEYSIKARVFVEQEIHGSRDKIMEAVQPIQVLPASQEEPPLNITKTDKLYKMSKTKTIRKSLLSAKSGSLNVSAAQPRSAMISSDGHAISTTDVQVNLAFEPTSSDSHPPKITGIASKITAVSYFAAGGINTFPNFGDWSRNYGIEGRGSYSSTTALLATPVDKLKWQATVNQQARRDSGYASDTSTNSRSEGSRRVPRAKTPPVTYTTSLQLPVKLPMDKKMFIPTYHSCITSRVYVLSVTVSLSTGGSNSTVTLALPMQVGVDSLDMPIDDAGLPSFEAAIEDAAADEFLRPRTLHVPEVEFERHSLPGYGDLSSRRPLAAN